MGEGASPPVFLHGQGGGEPPVFLHGMWRSGSTYVWSRFRTLPQACCYYEPLHHGLARLTHARIRRDGAVEREGLRHPALEGGYFDEFAPLVGLRGVKRYSPAFAYDRYALTPEDRHEALRRYVAGLVDQAAGTGRQAVLGFNRTGLRMAWLKARFGSRDIHIDRDPARIWGSYVEQMRAGNYAFFVMWLTTVERNIRHPLMEPLADRLGLVRHPRPRDVPPKRFYRAFAESLRPEASFGLVLYLWALTTIHALGAADLVIDMDRAAEPGYRGDCMEGVRNRCALAPDFGDMRAAPAAVLPGIDRRAAEREIAALFPRRASADFSDGWAAHARLPSLTPAKAESLAGFF